MKWGIDTWPGRTFIGAVNDEDAPNVLLGAPMDYSASFRPGSRFGPEAIRQVSYNLEEYSLQLARNLDDLRFFDAGDLHLPYGNVSRSLELIEQAVIKIIDNNRMPFVLGGDHLVSYPCLKACSRRWPGLTVVHIDAHADLRNEYMDEEYSHATVIGAALKELAIGRVFQFGVRSATQAEHRRAQEETEFYPFAFAEPLRRVIEEIQGPVYITLDIDVVDPGFAPGTGTPESGGITPTELFAGLQILASREIIGFDLVELAPAYDPSGITAALAAKIVREALLLYGKQP
ncbi:MAG: agmatinase [Firmicutes bacterium]|nr:agmatinase [Bacillota bacterium]